MTYYFTFMKNFYASIIALILLFTISKSYAQTASSNKEEKESSFKIGINYLNNNVTMGRADTITTPAILPELRYTFKNGIFISGSATYIPNRLTNKLDGESFTAGYDYDITENMSGGVSFAKQFYSAKSTQISSSISSTLSANFNYDIAGIITPAISADYSFIKDGFGNDIFVNLGISHNFAMQNVFGDNDLLIISPNTAINTGTQNFYDAYLIGKQFGKKAKSAAAQAQTAKQKAKLSKFKLLDFELSAPIEYKIGLLTLNFTPTYAVAENKLPARITKGFVNALGIFFFETGASLKF